MARGSPRSVVIHGHFYQPPREDPWLEELEGEPSAAPFHDWNHRIEQECYRAVVAARIPGEEGRIRLIRNTLASISFNFGPTLLEWMERKAPHTYRAVLEADAQSRRRLGGHGNAIAQPYHHTILPLASRRDKITEVRWGMADFRRRFGREPAGMWLPETAVDEATLDVLAQEGIAFTILAPHQVEDLPPGGGPGLFRAAGGRSVALFVYDGPLSHGVAFGGLLKDASAWARRLAGAGSGGDSRGHAPPGNQVPPPALISMATDGETFGHHHPFGEMALAAVLEQLRGHEGVRVENFASFLSRNPPRVQLRLVAPSSWSCAHGVERWRAPCGCKMHPSRPTQQEWRTHLRRAMTWLARELHRVFEEEAPPLLGHPSEARDGYGEVVSRGEEAIREYVRSRAPAPLTPPQELRARELLALERNALRLFTSCGWFFDDLAGIETLQILRYAALATELAGPRGAGMQEGFLSRLERGETNESPPRDGRTLYVEEVRPPAPAPLRVAAGFAALRALGVEDGGRVAGFRAEVAAGEEGAPPRLRVTHRRTGREWLVAAELLRAGPAGVEVKVSIPRHDPLLLGLLDLPEGYRDPVRQALKERILLRRLREEDREALLLGRSDLEGVAAAALLAAIRELAEPGEAGPPAQAGLAPEEAPAAGPAFEAVRELAALFLLLERPIPFDAQTEFFRALEGAPPERAAPLSRLAPTLGFVIPE